jgi:hypothetical protein
MPTDQPAPTGIRSGPASEWLSADQRAYQEAARARETGPPRPYSQRRRVRRRWAARRLRVG